MLTVAVQVLLLVPMFSAVTAVLASFMLKSADEAHSVLDTGYGFGVTAAVLYFKDHLGHGVLHGELHGAMSIGTVRYACREQQVEFPFGGGIADNGSARA